MQNFYKQHHAAAQILSPLSINGIEKYDLTSCSNFLYVEFPTNVCGTWGFIPVGFVAIALVYLILCVIWICIIIVLAVEYSTPAQAYFSPFWVYILT